MHTFAYFCKLLWSLANLCECKLLRTFVCGSVPISADFCRREQTFLNFCRPLRTKIYKVIGLRPLTSHVASGWSFHVVPSRFCQEGLPRRSQSDPKASPRPAKASPRLPKAAPRPPQASPRPPQDVPKGTPKAFPKDFKDYLKILEKPRKNNGFSMIFKSVWASSWPHVGLRWLILVHAGLS